MPMQTELANWLRADGLRVEEIAGWQSRGVNGEGTSGEVFLEHHTAGSPRGRAPSLSTCLYGVPKVSGPLCNLLQTREADGNDVILVLAAGKSNNAGSGGWRGVTGNGRTIGMEIEHVGTEHFPEHRAEIAMRATAAVLKGLGHTNGSMSCQHFEWSTAGKIDVATGVNPLWWREHITELMQGVLVTPTEPEGEEMIGIVAKTDAPDGFFVKQGEYWVFGPGRSAVRVGVNPDGSNQPHPQVLQDWGFLRWGALPPWYMDEKYVTPAVAEYVRSVRLDEFLAAQSTDN